MNRKSKIRLMTGNAVAAAAITGLFAGMAYAGPFGGKPDVRSTKLSRSGSGALIAGMKVDTLAAEAGKHDCKGHNSCAGQGGCKTGDNGCKGKNSCKGKGGCASDK